MTRKRWGIVNGLLFAILIATLCESGVAQIGSSAKRKYEWEKIALLVTTKGEVEEYFGKPIDETPFVNAIYSTDFGRITVWYQGSNQPGEWKCQFDLPMDIVMGYTVFLADSIPVSKFTHDLKTFTKNATHVGRKTYKNLDLGIFLAADEWSDKSEEIAMLDYFPTEKQFKCYCRKARESQ